MLATNDGRDPCAIVACVDGDRLPLTMFIFDGRPNLDDDLEEAVEMVMTASTRAHTSLAAMFLGSSRPGGELGPSIADEQRWVRMADRCADVGIDLLDWFIINDRSVCSVADTLRPGPGW
jgi:hypothetical protein